MIPIPPHLAALPWYAPHQAWLRATYGALIHDPGEAVAARADLRGANFHGADLTGANLTGANLTGANLTGANLTGAYLTGATGIRFAGPVGAEGRVIYAVAHAAGPRFYAGCFAGSVAEMVAAVSERYADGSGREQHRADYLAAVAFVATIAESCR